MTHPVPVSERIAVVYIDKGALEQDGFSLVWTHGDLQTIIPVGRSAVLMLGPGVVVTHAAVKVCAEEGVLLLWSGENGVRLYSAGNPRSSEKALLRQAKARLGEQSRLDVAKKIFCLMFGAPPPPRCSIEQIRGLEGANVKRWYVSQAALYGVDWRGKEASLSIPINRALAGCNAALYGLSEAVILALGYSPSVGFVHSGDARSFVFDLADTIKFQTVAPLAFQLAAREGDALTEGTVRRACRDLFFEKAIAKELVNILDGFFDADDTDRS